MISILVRNGRELPVRLERDAPIATAMAVIPGESGREAGPRPMGPMGPVDFLVLFVGLFLVVHVGAGPDDRLDQVYADRGTGPGSIGELAAGFLPPVVPGVCGKNNHHVAALIPIRTGRAGATA